MIVDYINNHQAEFWITAGFALLAIEVLILGLTTGVLLFSGLGALLTGLLMLLGVLPETWLAGIAGLGVSSGVLAMLLWKPLLRLQGDKTAPKDNSSDFVGLEFILDEEIKINGTGSKRYSGIEWRLEIDKNAGVEVIQAGQRVVVTSVDVGVFKVEPSS